MNETARQQELVLDALHTARSMELRAIQQYMVQHYTLEDLDYRPLAGAVRTAAIDEMRHAEALAERIKELGGEPESRLAGPVVHGQGVDEAFAFNAGLEEDTLARYNEWLALCLECRDKVSAALFERLILEEQAHFNRFEDIDRHVRTLGASFLARMAGSAD